MQVRKQKRDYLFTLDHWLIFKNRTKMVPVWLLQQGLLQQGLPLPSCFSDLILGGLQPCDVNLPRSFFVSATWEAERRNAFDELWQHAL